jgi:hypothetical protein
MIFMFQPMPATPTPLLPMAAPHPETCVPWPPVSLTSPPSTSARSVTALKPGTRAAARSGWVMSMPVSVKAQMTDAEPVVMSQALADCITV